MSTSSLLQEACVSQASGSVHYVLVVDDEPNVIATYRKGLGAAANAERKAALAALESSLFDQQQVAVSEGAIQFEVMACTQGAEAVDAVRRARQQGRPFAVIFLDITMPPGMDGVETAARIRAFDTDVNIVLVSGKRLVSPTSMMSRIPPAERLFFFQKPFHAVEFRQLASALCGKWQAEAALKAAHSDLETLVAERTQALAESQASLASAQHLAQLGSWDWDLVNDQVRGSDELYRLLGAAPGAIPACLDSILAITHPDDQALVKAAVLETLKSGCPSAISYRIRRPGESDERIFYQQTQAVHNDQGSIVRIQGTLQDISERQRAEEKIRYLAYFDSLTELPNRRFFHTRVTEALHLAKRHGRTLAMLFIDIDNFKRINDTLGHKVGDRLLKAVAEQLRTVVRDSDQVTRYIEQHDGNQLGRFGGDEFIALLSDIEQDSDAGTVARRLLHTLARPFDLGGHTISVTASIGISVFPNDGDDADTLLKHADTAMYHAKRAGKNDYQFFDAAMNEAALQRLTLENELRGALARGEFSLNYQPQLDLETGAIVGVEALLRWHSPQLGQVPPEAFIPLAEETGLIIPIGAWVLKTACAQAKAWQIQGLGALRVAVNLSARQFAQADLVQQITDTLRQTGLEAQYLELEITESLLMQDVERAIDTMVTLKAMGIQLAIDDFGTGYSSLSYLQRFPIDRLKIDRSFVSKITTNPDSAAIALAVVAMAHSLKLSVVAEGVETNAQQSLLVKQACDEVQGFYFSRPLPPQELAELLQRHHTAENSGQPDAIYQLLVTDDAANVDSIRQTKLPAFL